MKITIEITPNRVTKTIGRMVGSAREHTVNAKNSIKTWSKIQSSRAICAYRNIRASKAVQE